MAYPKMHPDSAARKMLREKLDRYSIPEPNSGCHLWLGGYKKGGYGIVSVGTKHQELAHRASYTVNRGPIPPGMYVCHKCDVTGCINPDHLFLGSPTDNNRDAARKGRSRGRVGKGSLNGNAKINETIAAAIRAATGTQKEIAARYGVSSTTVYYIRSGRYWVAA